MTTTQRVLLTVGAAALFMVVFFIVQAARGEFLLSDLLIQFAVFVVGALVLRIVRRRRRVER